MLSAQAISQIQQLKNRYPHPRSAVMPALYLAQEECGWLPREAIEDVAAELDMTPTEVGSVASFYTMFHLKPVGRNVVEFCTDLPCALRGADEAYLRLRERLGLGQNEETTADGTVTLRQSPCLGGCDKAPVLLVNGSRQYSAMTDAQLDLLVKELTAEFPARELKSS